MYSKDRYKSTIAFVDLLFNILVGFVFLFLVAFLMINPVAKKADVDKKAEFLITMTWPHTSPQDIDLWVMGPDKKRVGFASKETGLMHLERDDLGWANDTIKHGGKITVLNQNIENTSIRGIVPGDYYVSVHFYSQNQLFQDPIPVKIRIEKINPYSILYEGTKYLTVEGQTVNYVYFAVDDRGEVLSIENSNQSAVGIINKNPMYESAPNPRNPG
jgi:hypothetical protein